MATIANLAVSLTAKTAEFVTGMKSARKYVTSLGTGAASVVTKIGAVGAALAGLAGAASVTMLVKNSMEAIDANAKLADSLGMTTEGLAGLQHAADLSGVSQEDLSKAMQRTVREFGSMDKFYEIADLIQNTANAGDRAKIAYEAFGRSGQNLLPMLAGGAAGLREMEKDAVALGLAYSRVDAQQVEAANDAMTRAGNTVTGLGNTIAIQLAPFIQSAADKFTGLAISGNGMGEKVVSAIEWVVKGLAQAADFVELLKAAFYAGRGVIIGAIGGITGAIEGMIRAFAAAAEFVGADGMAAGARRVADEIGSAASALIEDSRTAFADMQAAAGSFWDGDQSKRVQAFFNEVRQSARQNAEAIQQDAKNSAASAAIKDLSGMDDEKKEPRAGEFKTMSLNRYAITGLDSSASGLGKKEVKDSTVAAKLDRLIQIVENRRGFALE